jgi:hypothetical protein
VKKQMLTWILITLFALIAVGCSPQSTPPPGPIGPQPGGGSPRNPQPDGPQPGGPQPGNPQPGSGQDPNPNLPGPATPEGGAGGGNSGGEYLDLALSDLYLQGTVVYFSIRNVGTMVLPDQPIGVTCNGEYTDGGGTTELLPSQVSVPAHSVAALGSAAEVDAGYSLLPMMTTLTVECSIDPNPLDHNPDNDRIGPVKLK